MPNIYDQFDQEGGTDIAAPPAAGAAPAAPNPYDQFDAPGSGESPQPRGDLSGGPGAAISAEPRSIGQRLRELLSPVLGETPEQTSQRHALQQQLIESVPVLADKAYNQDTERDTQRGSLHKAAMTAASIGLQGGGAALGAAGGAATPIPGAAEVLGGVGGAAGNLAYQELAKSVGDQDRIMPGQVVGAGISSAIPGAALASRGVGGVLSAGAKAGAAGLAGKVAETEIDEGRLPTAGEALASTAIPAVGGAVAKGINSADPEITQATKNALAATAEKRATLAAGQEAGYVVTPSQANPSFANKALESLGGKAAVGQAASKANQPVTDSLMKETLGLAPDDVLTSEAAQAVRKDAYKAGYEPVATLGPISTDFDYKQALQNIQGKYQGASKSFPGVADNGVGEAITPLDVKEFDAGDGLKMIQSLRNRATDAFQNGNTELGRASKEAAGALEDQIERHLAAQPALGSSAPEMLSNFRDARQLMAQSHDVEDAIREGTGEVSAPKLGGKLQQGRPLSGNLETAGRMANLSRKDMRVASMTPTAGVSALHPLASLGASALGAAAGGAAHGAGGAAEGAGIGAAAGVGYSLAKGAVRKMILSGPYQRLMTKIPLDVQANPTLLSQIVREGGEAAGEEAPEER